MSQNSYAFSGLVRVAPAARRPLRRLTDLDRYLQAPEPGHARSAWVPVVAFHRAKGVNPGRGRVHATGSAQDGHVGAATGPCPAPANQSPSPVTSASVHRETMAAGGLAHACTAGRAGVEQPLHPSVTAQGPKRPPTPPGLSPGAGQLRVPCAHGPAHRCDERGPCPPLCRAGSGVCPAAHLGKPASNSRRPGQHGTPGTTARHWPLCQRPISSGWRPARLPRPPSCGASPR